MSLEHRYATDGGVDNAAVRDALASLTADDISESSPVTPGIPEAGTAHEGDHLVVRISGGDWTKTSEEAIRKAIGGIDGVEELVESSGGYDT